jgi:hypothetical protein
MYKAQIHIQFINRYRLPTPNPKVQNLKCSKTYILAANLMLRVFWILNFR